ncbi:ABC-type Fe3+-hydroxamate transport system substrate-binding protein [Paenibacillus brasilensis]|uniref:ABC-type Fe3+-hydroxamate transport system substrate-binding protein n=1 Tax=Paenibacillus brasilensis TaxID=128574 RepID=A0ABU0L2W1_9BACL|nr:ABC-type Fe3+-hydroxamate transport system substrate-binding protein [Paenibacillus brasilensis]
MQKEIQKLGDRFDKAEKAKEINGALDAKIAEIQQKIKGKKSPKVLILLGVPGSYLVATEHSYIGDLVKMFDDEFKTNDIWKHFNAVKKGHVYDLPEPLFGTTGNLAASSALDELMKMLYPSN